MRLVSKNLPFVQSKYLINSFCNLGPFRKGAYGQGWNLLVFFYYLYARQLCNIVQARSRSWVSQSKMNISGKSMMLLSPWSLFDFDMRNSVGTAGLGQGVELANPTWIIGSFIPSPYIKNNHKNKKQNVCKKNLGYRSVSNSLSGCRKKIWKLGYLPWWSF